MNLHPILVLAGDRGRARLFKLDRGYPGLVELDDLVNPTLRIHERLLSGDRQGRVFNRIRGSRTALGEAKPHKQIGAERFACTVADRVQSCCRTEQFARIYLVANPEFTGLIRPKLKAKRLGPPLTGISKNLTRHTVLEIRDHLPRDPWGRRAPWRQAQ